MEAAAKKRAFGFDGANVTRLNGDWMRSPQSADSELRYSLRNLRFRCREQERNDDWMRKALSLFEDNVVGASGILLQMKIYDMVKDPITKEMVRNLNSKACETIEAAWKEQCEPANYTVTRKHSDVETDKLVVRSITRDGDILQRKVRGYPNKFKYAIQNLEADYLDDFRNDTRTLPNGNQVRLGVEVDHWKCPVAYWVMTEHPGDFNYGWDAGGRTIRLDASECIHPFIQERPEQSRGYPWFVSAMNRLNMLKGYEEAALVASRTAACKTVMYEHDRPQIGQPGAGYTGPESDNWRPQESFEPGTTQDLPMGTKAVLIDPKHPTDNYPAFTKQQLRAVAAAIGVSYTSLANDLTDVNFSSIRAGLLDEREGYKGIQNFYVSESKNIYFEDWLEWVLLNGMLPGLRASDLDYLNQKIFKCRRWDWVDPLKDINAAVTAIEAGLDTRSNVIGNRGGDYEDVMAELNYEKGFQENMGLDFGSAQPSSDKSQFPDNEKGADGEDKTVPKAQKKSLRFNPNHDEKGEFSSGSGGDLEGGKFTPDKENGGGSFEHGGHVYPVDEDGNFKDHSGKEYSVTEDGDAKAHESDGDREAGQTAYHDAISGPQAKAGKAFEDKYEQIIKESGGDKNKEYDRIHEPGQAAHDAAKEAAETMSLDHLKLIAEATTGKIPKSAKKLKEVVAQAVANSVGHIADIHMENVHEKLGTKKKGRSLEINRLNPNHAKQPRSDDGTWTKDEINALESIWPKLQEMMKKPQVHLNGK